MLDIVLFFLSCLALGAFAQSTGSSCGTRFCVNARHDGVYTMTYTLISTDPLTDGWAAVGTGTQMLDSDMYIVWSTGNEVILSQRQGGDATAPSLAHSAADAQLDTGGSSTNSSRLEAILSVPMAQAPLGDWPMIWAWSNGGSPGSNAATKLKMHSDFGRMTLPMQAIAVPSDPSSSSIPSSVAAVPNATFDVAKHRRVLWAHASMMILAWGIVCPMAVLFARFGRGIWPRWVKAHQFVQVPVLFTLLCTAIGLGIGAREISGNEHAKGKHALLGIAVFALYIVQLILGFITHGLYEPNRTHRPMQNWAHMTLGILLLALAWYTARTGIIMFGVKEWGKTLYWVWIGLLIAAYAGGYALLPRQLRAERAAKMATNPSVRLQNIRTAAEAFGDRPSMMPDTATSDTSMIKDLDTGSSVQFLVSSPAGTEQTPSISRTSPKASKGWL